MHCLSRFRNPHLASVHPKNQIDNEVQFDKVQKYKDDQKTKSTWKRDAQRYTVPNTNLPHKSSQIWLAKILESTKTTKGTSFVQRWWPQATMWITRKVMKLGLQLETLICLFLQFQNSICTVIDEILKFHPPSFHPIYYDIRMSTELNNHPRMYSIHPS
jgi:hypothetical protein